MDREKVTLGFKSEERFLKIIEVCASEQPVMPLALLS